MSAARESNWPAVDDPRHAEAFRDLEDAVNRARSAAIVAEMTVDDVGTGGEAGRAAATRLGLRDYAVLILTEDQMDALHYTVHHARDAADALYRVYYAGFGRQASP